MHRNDTTEATSSGSPIRPAPMNFNTRSTSLALWKSRSSARIAPGALARLASPDPARRGHAWWVFLHHAQLSADAARSAGLGERVAAFIAGLAPAGDERLAMALHAADEAS